MSINISKKTDFLSKKSFLAFVLCGVLTALSACGSDSIDSGVVEYSEHSAFNFDAANTELAAEIAASSMSFFPEYAYLSQTVVAVFRMSEPMWSPFSLSAILCVSGKATLYWYDNDLSRDFSSGDSALLLLTDCDLDGWDDIVSGEIEIDFSTVDDPQFSFSSLHEAVVDITISSVSGTTNFSTRLKANVETHDATNYYNTYEAMDTSDQALIVTKNGVEYLKLGCFSITVTFEFLGMMNESTCKMSPSGVINSSNEILSLESGSTISILTGMVESGRQRLLSASVPNCEVTGTLYDVPDSDGSYLDIEMLGGNVVELMTYDINGVQTYSVVTTWDQLK